MRKRRRSRLKAEMNVVPYIDVMLVLLVIFMIAAPLIHQQTIKIDLPDSPSQLSQIPEEIKPNVLPLVLTIDTAGHYYLNRGVDESAPKAPFEIQKIASEVLAISPNLPVIVQGDANVPYEKIFDGIILLQQAGAKSVGLSSELPKKSEGN